MSQKNIVGKQNLKKISCILKIRKITDTKERLKLLDGLERQKVNIWINTDKYGVYKIVICTFHFSIISLKIIEIEWLVSKKEERTIISKSFKKREFKRNIVNRYKQKVHIIINKSKHVNNHNGYKWIKWVIDDSDWLWIKIQLHSIYEMCILKACGHKMFENIGMKNYIPS